jgi:hypothetical protein
LGKYYPSEHRLSLPSDLPPGEYLVVAGLHHFPDAGQRVSLSGSQPPRYFVVLDGLTVTP